MAGAESSPQNQNTEHQTSQDGLDWEPIPKKRKPRLASIFICLVAATGIIVYGFIKKTVFEYKAVNDLSATKFEAIKNGTIIIYTREEKKTYPVLFNLGLGLLAIILGTVVDRLCLVVEELCQFRSRYKRNILKVFKSCFSGISWPAVLVIFGVGGISLVVSKKNSFELGNLIYILGGIGVGPLVTHLLNLNTQSEVDVSRLQDEKRLYPAYTIAWNYYFHYLRKALPIFNERFSDSNIPVQDQSTSQSSLAQTAQPKVQLSLKKLILLISHNCKTKDNLAELDNHIRKITDISNDEYTFPVYGLTSHGKEHKYVVLFAKEPLETLREMSKSERIKAIHENQCEDQVMLLYRTLISEILNDPLDDQCSEKCILVPIMAENANSLQNGGLVKLIMTKVNADECALKHEELDGFIKAPTPAKKPVHTQEMDDTLDEKSGRNLVEKYLPSHTLNIDIAKGEARYRTQGYFTDSRNQYENDALFKTEGEQGIRLERDVPRHDRGKAPVNNGQLQRKYKRKSSPSERQPMLRNSYEPSIGVDVHDNTKQAGESKGVQTMMSNGQAEIDDRQVNMSDNPKESGSIGETDKSGSLVNGKAYERKSAMSDRQRISCHTGEAINQQKTSSFMDGGGNIPGGDGYEGDSPPISNCIEENENQSMSGHFKDGGQNCQQGEVDNREQATSYNPSMSDQTEENQPTSCSSMTGGENGTGGEEDDKEPAMGDSSSSSGHSGETDNETMSSGNIIGGGENCHRVGVIVAAPYSGQTGETENKTMSGTSRNGGDEL